MSRIFSSFSRAAAGLSFLICYPFFPFCCRGHLFDDLETVYDPSPDTFQNYSHLPVDSYISLEFLLSLNSFFRGSNSPFHRDDKDQFLPQLTLLKPQFWQSFDAAIWVQNG